MSSQPHSATPGRPVARTRRAAVTLVCILALLAGLPPAGAVATAGAEERLLALIARERAERGLPAIAMTADLADSARTWSQEMAAKGSLGHSPDSVCCASAQAENVGMSGGRSLAAAIERVHAGFMDSPNHRGNLLDARFTQFGAGVAVDADGTVWVTVQMRAPNSSAPSGRVIEPAPRPEPEPEPEPAPEPREDPEPQPARPSGSGSGQSDQDVAGGGGAAANGGGGDGGDAGSEDDHPEEPPPGIPRVTLLLDRIDLRDEATSALLDDQ